MATTDPASACPVPHVERMVRDHCLAPSRVDAPLGGGRYRRLFDDLPALIADEAALHALGREGGLCDLGADWATDTDSRVAAVWPFFGQFVAHDITADRSPIAGHPGARADALRNARAPRLDLEGIYGAGPVGNPFLYEKDDPAKLLLAPGGADLPRNQEGIALVGDPRNDVQLFTSQMTVAFIHMHNRLVDRLRADGVGEMMVFDEARRSATWHYQHVVLREFLPGLIGAELAAELLDGGARLYGADPAIPFEFADAAYRYGHAQIRPAYMVNKAFGPLPLLPDLMGFGPVPAQHAVDWTLMIDVDGSGGAQRAKRIDARLPSSLIALPVAVSGSAPGTDYASLATRDLQRGAAVGLASGEAIARRLGIAPLTTEQLGLREHGWTAETPLWLYVLKEAEVLHGGDRLGPVGGRIVGEVLVGIADADPASFRAVNPSWTPTLPARGGRDVFGLADVLVPPDAG